MKTENKNTTKKTILITGASSGIGRATALRLAQPGHIVLLNGRNIAKLEAVQAEVQTQGAEAHILQADLSEPPAREKFIREIDTLFGCPDIIVINAGMGWFGYFHKMPLEIAGAMHRLMIDALIAIDSHYLPKMLERKSGHIIHIGSVVGGMPNNGIAIYSAIKAYMDNFCTSVYRELKGSGVHISIVRPGPIKSEFFEHARAQEKGGAIPGESMAVSPDRVAKVIAQLIRHPRRVCYVPGYYWFSKFWEPFMGWFVDLLGPILLKNS